MPLDLRPVCSWPLAAATDAGPQGLEGSWAGIRTLPSLQLLGHTFLAGTGAGEQSDAGCQKLLQEQQIQLG